MAEEHHEEVEYQKEEGSQKSGRWDRDKVRQDKEA
jgi:hypothetical protein